MKEGNAFLEGFHLYGFDVPDDFLRWIGGATVGEIGGLLYIAYRYLFRTADPESSS